MKRPWLILFLAGIFFGCGSSSYSIHILDSTPAEVYLTYAKGASVKIGDTFALYHVENQPSSGEGWGSHAGHGGSGPTRHKVEDGRVQVVSIADETHALVKVLSGNVHEGMAAEKVE